MKNLSFTIRRRVLVCAIGGVCSTTAAWAQEAAKPKLNVGVGLRTGLTLDMHDEQSDSASLYLDDGLVDQLLVRPYLSGQLNEHVGFAANFEAGTPGGLGFEVMDAMVQLRVVDELQFWIGQHIPANDRNNMNGPFYHNLWNFPIVVQSHPFDRAARDRGITAWGLLAEGALTYYLSVVDLQTPAASADSTNALEGSGIGNARYAGRVTVNLWEPDGMYYSSGTYFGKKDVLALGLVAQYQAGVYPVTPGTDLDNDYSGFSADLFMEKNLGTGGTVTFEAGYWNLEGVGEDYVVNAGTRDQGRGVAGPVPGSSYMAAFSWLSPGKVGAGQLQPGARMQVGDYGTDKTYALDVGIGYIVDGFNHRWHLNYRHQEAGDAAPPDNWLQIGAQVQL
jgi:hypothetical protein